MELLGDEADHVRVGALHALAGLAKTWPGMQQTVIDILCAYLRRPFDHIQYRTARGMTGPVVDADKADNERQVRLTSQRLIQDLLTAAAEPMRLDLTGAVLENFTLRSVKLTSLQADNASFHQATVFESIKATSELSLRGATLFGTAKFTYCELGGLTLDDAIFHGDADFSASNLSGKCRALATAFRGALKCQSVSFGSDVTWRIDVTGSADFDDAIFQWGVDLSDSQFRGDATFDGAYLLKGEERTGKPTSFEDVAFGQSLSFRIGEPIPVGFTGLMRVRSRSSAVVPPAFEVVPHNKTWHSIRRRQSDPPDTRFMRTAEQPGGRIHPP
ncbi:pentapeptide repeat-containing protein [Actinosynnema sp. ALI-1.44]|uniref:pentapeptide repeat-containing protein n=1 Tax=Actinosynnema sp. ALI-1.44 TaxID=1933779 RepID=UPI00117784AC|nr:pentapeptide repeat-containing protein [Actinosynnema sp. ALI-1.44]